MAGRKRNQKRSKLEVFSKATLLANYILDTTRRAPRGARGHVVDRLNNHAIDVLEHILSANNIRIDETMDPDHMVRRAQLRIGHQEDAKTTLMLLPNVAWLARTCGAITKKQFEVICQETDEVSRMMKAWMQRDRQRFAKILQAHGLDENALERTTTDTPATLFERDDLPYVAELE